MRSRTPSTMDKLIWFDTPKAAAGSIECSTSPPQTFRDCVPFIPYDFKNQNHSIDKLDISNSNNNDTTAAAATAAPPPTSFPRNSSNTPRFTKESISAEKCRKLSPAKRLPLPYGSSSPKRPATEYMSEEACKWPDAEMLERFTDMKNRRRSSCSLGEKRTGLETMYWGYGGYRMEGEDTDNDRADEGKRKGKGRDKKGKDKNKGKDV